MSLRRRAGGWSLARSDLTHTAATAASELLRDGVLVISDGEVVLANRALARLPGGPGVRMGTPPGVTRGW